MRAEVAVARATGLMLRRHVQRSVGGRLAASLLAASAVVAVLTYNLFAFQFLSRFLPSDLPQSSTISGAVLIDALAAAQATSAGGMAVLVLILAPGSSELRIAAQVLSARRFQARIGESLPFIVLLVLAAALLTIGPSLYLTTLVGAGPVTFLILLGVETATAVAVAVVAESMRLLGTLSRLSVTMSQLVAVISAVAVVALAVYDSARAAQRDRSPAVATWIDVLTGFRGLDGSWAAAGVATGAVAMLVVGALAVRLAQPAEPLDAPQRLVTLRALLPARAGRIVRECTMAFRQPLAQMSATVAAAGIALLGIAVRGGVLPLEAATIGAGMLAAAPLELAWARTTPWVWLYRKDRVSAPKIVGAQLTAGLLSAFLLSSALYFAAGTLPSLALLGHHCVVVAAAGSIAYLAGVLLPASGAMPASVALTSTIALVLEAAMVWVGNQADIAQVGLGSAVIGATAVLAAAAATLRVAHWLDAD